MERKFSQFLHDWLRSKQRKPLVIRGARQVGKTWLVRHLAKTASVSLMEVNFERNPEYAKYFSSNNPERIFDDLSLALQRAMPHRESILFLDEIQAAPEVLAKLRWFAEEMPELPVIAAGSLLEFTLENFQHSMPVGRIRYGFVEPLGFFEYLQAHNQKALLDRLEEWSPGKSLSDATHEMATMWFERYAMVGGMPGVVAMDVAGESAEVCRGIQRDLVQTYREDFGKYSRNSNHRILDKVLQNTTASLGKKFVYSQVDPEVRHYQAKTALELLAMARLCDLIPHTAANGIPLAAESNDRIRKVALLDIGIAHALWNTPAGKRFPPVDDLAPQIRGGMIEQMTAQLLRIAQGEAKAFGQLFHWRREGGRTGEIDYIIESNTRIIPIEVKSGKAGTMKSLHQFMHEKSLNYAVRLDQSPPSQQTIQVKTTQGQPVSYHLQNLPHYLCERVAE